MKRICLFLLLLPIIINAQNGSLKLKTFKSIYNYPVTSVGFPPNKNQIAGGDQHGHLVLWNIKSGQMEQITRLHNSAITQIDFNENMNKVLTVSGTQIGVWKYPSMEKIGVVTLSAAPKLASFNDQGNLIYIVDKRGLFKMRSFRPGPPSSVYNELEEINVAAISANKGLILYHAGNAVKLYDIFQNKVVKEWQDVCSTGSNDIKMLNKEALCLCKNGNVYVLNANTTERLSKIDSDKTTTSVSISFDEKWFFLLKDNQVVAHSAETNEAPSSLGQVNSKITSSAGNQAGTYFATGSMDGTITLWDLNRLEEMSIPQVIYTENSIPIELNGRIVEQSETVEVKATELELFVWDKDRYDGDTISILLNGEWLLTNYGVSKTPYKLTVKLNPNMPNILVLYADNLGSKPPNTAAISYTVGRKEKILTLDSDLIKCSAINFVVK